MPKTIDALLTRKIPHAAGEPETLVGRWGEPLDRGVYDVRAANGKMIWVAVADGGSVLASVRIPQAAREPVDNDRVDFAAIVGATERWAQALARIYIELERLDPTNGRWSMSYPDFKSITW